MEALVAAVHLSTDTNVSIYHCHKSGTKMMEDVCSELTVVAFGGTSETTMMT